TAAARWTYCDRYSSLRWKARQTLRGRWLLACVAAAGRSSAAWLPDGFQLLLRYPPAIAVSAHMSHPFGNPARLRLPACCPESPRHRAAVAGSAIVDDFRDLRSLLSSVPRV